LIARYSSTPPATNGAFDQRHLATVLAAWPSRHFLTERIPLDGLLFEYQTIDMSPHIRQFRERHLLKTVSSGHPILLLPGVGQSLGDVTRCAQTFFFAAYQAARSAALPGVTLAGALSAAQFADARSVIAGLQNFWSPVC
jgi:hypothetical protein